MNDAPVGDSHEQTKLQADPEISQQVKATMATISAEKAYCSPVQNFFISVWMGEWGLAKTYWIIGVALGSLLGAAITPSKNAGPLLLALIIVVIIVYQAWVLVGIWRAAGKYKGPIVWRHLSRGATLIGTVFVLVVAAGIFKQVFSEFGEVQKPIYKVGDTWNFKYPTHAITDQFYTVSAKVVQNEYGLSVHEDSIRNWRSFVSYYSRAFNHINGIPFPIKPGKTWKETNPNGLLTEHVVLGWETIEVAAGVFRTLKIQYRYFYNGEEKVHTYWYSPKVKYFVKSKTDDIVSDELLSYSLK